MALMVTIDVRRRLGLSILTFIVLSRTGYDNTHMTCLNICMQFPMIKLPTYLGVVVLLLKATSQNFNFLPSR